MYGLAMESGEETALRVLEYLNIEYPENLAFTERRSRKQGDALSEEWVRRYDRCNE